MTAPALPQIPTVRPTSDDLAERGFKMVKTKTPTGDGEYEYVPLTRAEYIHPKAGYHLPNSTFRDKVVTDLVDMLTRRFQKDDSVEVFTDLIFVWQHARMRDHCPDIAVVFGIKNKGMFRPRFRERIEGVRPRLIIEVVSPSYRSADRVDKLMHYETLGIQEYLILDRRESHGEISYDVLGYELIRGRYRPLVPDEEGRVLSRTVGVRVGLDNEEVSLVDAESGNPILNARQEQAAREAAEARARDLEAQIQALQAELARRRS